MSHARQLQLLQNTARYIDYWQELMIEQREVTNVMNMFRQQDEYMECHCWIPEESVERVKTEIEACDFRLNQTSKTILTVTAYDKNVQPPTYIPTNKYTRVYQNIVNSYGVPCYKEINPGYFYLYQFPFTFSLMFGDVGHGIINTLASMMLIIFEKKL